MPNSEVKRSCADDTASITAAMFYERLSAAKALVAFCFLEPCLRDCNAKGLPNLVVFRFLTLLRKKESRDFNTRVEHC